MRGGFLPVILAGLTPIIVLALLVTGIGLSLVQWQPPALWTTQFGTPNSPPASVQNAVSVVSADTTGLYAGGFVGWTNFAGVNPSPSNLFVSRYDPEGRQVWTKSFGDPVTDEIRGIAVGAGGVYISGSLNGSGFVRRYDLNGNQVWTSPFGSEATSVSVGTNGVYAAGGAVLRAYDFNGNTVWTDSLGGPLLFSNSKGIYLAGCVSAGCFLWSYDFNGTLKWTRFTCNCAPSGVSADTTGIYVAGYFNPSGFLSKYDWNGNQVWTRNLDAPDYAVVHNLQMSVNPSGVYLAMSTLRSGFLMRYDGNGNQVWSFQVHRSLNAISVGENGVYVGGKDSFVETQGNAFITEFSQSSSLILFGLNPPYSFGLVSLLAGLTALSILWLRRGRKKKVRPPSANRNYESRGRRGPQPTGSKLASSLH